MCQSDSTKKNLKRSNTYANTNILQLELLPLVFYTRVLLFKSLFWISLTHSSPISISFTSDDSISDVMTVKWLQDGRVALFSILQSSTLIASLSADGSSMFSTSKAVIQKWESCNNRLENKSLMTKKILFLF